jgi:hypothetical protein
MGGLAFPFVKAACLVYLFGTAEPSPRVRRDRKHVVEIAVVGAAIRTAPGMDTPGPVSQPAQRVGMSESIFRRCINQDRRLRFINDRISQYPKRV